MATATLSNIRQNLSKIEPLRAGYSVPGAVDYFDVDSATSRFFAGFSVHL